MGRAFAGVVAALVAAVSSGCGSSDRPYPVRGTVLYEDGRPATELAGGVVTFQPAEEGRPGASGTIDAEGNYVLSAQRPRDGAYPGRYKVSISPPLPSGDEGGGRPQAKRPRVLPPHYREPATSGIAVTVEPKSNDIPLTVDRGRSPG